MHTVHSTPKTNKENTIKMGVIEELYYKWGFSKNDYLLAVSKDVKEYLKRIGYPNAKIIHNAINTEYFNRNRKLRNEFRKELGIEKNTKLILNVAQLTPRKGVYDFVEIARQNPNMQFLWIGGMPFSILTKDYHKIKKLINTNFKNLRFYGYINDIRKAYSAADIFLTPSYGETFGLTIIEAASSGLPIIARDLIEYKELFGNQIEYARDNNEFSNKIKTLKSRKELVKKSTRLCNKFDIKKEGNKLLRLYKSLLHINKKINAPAGI